MRTNPIQQISFSGLKIDGTVSAKNIKKLNEITKKIEESEFISDLENNFNTDIVLNSGLDTVSFSHKTYGSLSKYNLSLPTDKLFLDVSNLMNNIKTAIKKAEKNHLNSQTIYESSRRGC